MDCGTLQTPRECAILRVSDGRAVCPSCRRRTRQRIDPDTKLDRFPLYCDKCQSIHLVSYRGPLPILSESQ